MSVNNTTPAPRLTIGLPVYNGQPFIARAIESMLKQSFRDFELIITDNASTDGTHDVLRHFAQEDSRVQVHRADRNHGVVRNFNWPVELARGELFKWCAADDLCKPTYLQKCIALLDADPSVVLAFTRTQIIDHDGQPTRRNDYDADADYPQPHVRFSRVIHIDHRRHCAQEVYGVMRTAALRRTPLYEPYVRTDSTLLARLALMGRFRCVEERLFLNREHEERSVRLVPGEKVRTRSRLSQWIGIGPVPPSEFWNRELAGRITFPEWRVLGEYIRSLQFAELSRADYIRCQLVLARFALKHSPKLVRDLCIAAEHMILGIPGWERQPSESQIQPKLAADAIGIGTDGGRAPSSK